MSEQLWDKETIFIDEAMTMATHLVEPIYLKDCKADALEPPLSKEASCGE
jgi:hypothetical protein